MANSKAKGSKATGMAHRTTPTLPAKASAKATAAITKTGNGKKKGKRGY